MENKYSGMSDAEIVNGVLNQYDLTHEELAVMLYVSRPRITLARLGKTRLRPAIREKLESMLIAIDEAEAGTFTIDGGKA